MKEKCCNVKFNKGRWFVNLFTYTNLPWIRRTVVFEFELSPSVGLLNLGCMLCLRPHHGDITISLPFLDLLVGYHRSWDD